MINFASKEIDLFGLIIARFKIPVENRTKIELLRSERVLSGSNSRHIEAMCLGFKPTISITSL
jgi:hypothetical protein